LKKVLGIGIILLIMLLGACGQRDAEPDKDDQEDKQTDQIEEVSTEPEEEQVEEIEEVEDNEEEPSQSKEDTSQAMSEDELKELIEYTGMGDGDELVSATIEDEEIKAVINLAPSDLFSSKDLAVTRYSQASDELLTHEGWEKLTIEYSDIGTVSMDRSEVESNEYGGYFFPTMEIENRLK